MKALLDIKAVNPFQVINKLLELSEIFITGSSVICTPAVTNTDLDIIVLLDSNAKVYDYLEKENFQHDLGGEYEDLDFYSFRKESINVIVVLEKEYFNKFKSLTIMATSLNITSKEQRVQFFNSVLRPEEDEYDGAQ